MRRLGMILMLMTLVAGVVACETDQDVQKDIAKSVQSGEAVVIPVTASSLYAAYEANRIGADAKYKDAIVRVTGIVTSIDEDILGDAYVTLTDGGQFSMWGVQCYFADSNRAALAGLNKGQSATLNGRVSDYLLNVAVRGCTVE